jgi:flagellar biosynthesis protein FliP
MSVSLQVLLFMTVLSLLPALLMTMTAFTRIIIVLSILRQGLGTQQTPNNQVLIGIALFLTFFVMAPVINTINSDALQPYMDEEIGPQEALQAGIQPVREFMLSHTRESDLMLFAELVKPRRLRQGQRMCRCRCWCRRSSPAN